MTPLVIDCRSAGGKLARRFPLFASAVKVGNRLTISTPNNLFALIPQPESICLSRAVLVSPLSCRTGRAATQRRRLAATLLLAKSKSCAFRDELVQHPQAEKVHLITHQPEHDWN